MVRTLANHTAVPVMEMVAATAGAADIENVDISPDSE